MENLPANASSSLSVRIDTKIQEAREIQKSLKGIKVITNLKTAILVKFVLYKLETLKKENEALSPNLKNKVKITEKISKKLEKVSKRLENIKSKTLSNQNENIQQIERSLKEKPSAVKPEEWCKDKDIHGKYVQSKVEARKVLKFERDCNFCAWPSSDPSKVMVLLKGDPVPHEIEKGKFNKEMMLPWFSKIKETAQRQKICQDKGGNYVEDFKEAQEALKNPDLKFCAYPSSPDSQKVTVLLKIEGASRGSRSHRVYEFEGNFQDKIDKFVKSLPKIEEWEKRHEICKKVKGEYVANVKKAEDSLNKFPNLKFCAFPSPTNPHEVKVLLRGEEKLTVFIDKEFDETNVLQFFLDQQRCKSLGGNFFKNENEAVNAFNKKPPPVFCAYKKSDTEVTIIVKSGEEITSRPFKNSKFNSEDFPKELKRIIQFEADCENLNKLHPAVKDEGEALALLKKNTPGHSFCWWKGKDNNILIAYKEEIGTHIGKNLIAPGAKKHITKISRFNAPQALDFIQILINKNTQK